ncbi:hypothetical protein BASA81_007590 [Batrachochytrium salamandrivorans]|nr:hypothetical protein BASA81_007590 [Batrachochytrium salamandrivorans]
MLSCCRGVRAAKTGREDRPSFGESEKNMPRAEALERFDQLRIREVGSMDGLAASAFRAKFQSIAASLEPDERIKLVVYAHRNSVELLEAVLADPQANKISILHWEHIRKEDVNSVIPLLINNCPELAFLRVHLSQHSEFDFVSSVLEHPSVNIRVLEMPENAKGDSTRLFAALGRSQVSALTIYSGASPEFCQGLCKYLAKDLLVRLKIWRVCRQVPPEMAMSLAKCTRLAKLEMLRCELFRPTAFNHLPKSITKLVLFGCMSAGDFDWSFLADSNVRELDFQSVRGVDGNQLGSALVVHLRAKGLDELRLRDCRFVDETLAVVGVELGRIKKLDLENSVLNDASVELIALALQAPNNELRELTSWYNWDAVSIKNHLVPALKHPNCNLAELNLLAYVRPAKTMEATFRKRRALLVLLQGQQVKRRYCPLRRLPVEMFRLVGKALI